MTHEQGKARPLSDLRGIFEQEGCTGVKGYDAKGLPDSAQAWLALDHKAQEAVCDHFRLVYLSDAFVNWWSGAGHCLGE